MNKMLTAAVMSAVSLAWAGVASPRPPVVAGRFYPAEPKALAALVEKELAAAATIRLRAAAEIVALLVPHAGLEFSGPTAARAYKLLKPGAYDTVVVLGTCHYKELDGAAIYPGAYGTPGGALAYDAAFGARLRKLSPLIREDASAHKKEYSIEVQVPFLRRVLGAKTKLVAVVMNTQDLETARQIGHALAEAAKGKRVLLVASSDQSHYPSGSVADAVDRTTLEALKSLDPAYFWLTNRFLMNRALPHLAVTYCGEGAVTAVLAAARELGASQAHVLDHINSGDVVSEREYNHVVGYAAAAFTRQAGTALPPRLTLGDKQKGQLLAAARKALEQSRAGHKAAAPLSGEPRFNLPAGVFVTLRQGTQLRGSFGSSDPQDSLLEAVVRNASAGSAAGDPAGLKIEISVLSPSRPVAVEEIKPGDGVAIELDARSGVLLPAAWEKFPKKEDFLAELCAQRAGLPRDCWKSAAARFKAFAADSFADGSL